MEKVNYTEDQVRELVARYQAGETVETIAEILGRSVRSVVAKLSREGVYKPKTKAITTRTTKTMMVREIEVRLGLEPNTLESFEGCNKQELQLLLQSV